MSASSVAKKREKKKRKRQRKLEQRKRRSERRLTLDDVLERWMASGRFIPFNQTHPEISETETRSLTLTHGEGPVPPGVYCLTEAYCADPECEGEPCPNGVCLLGACQPR